MIADIPQDRKIRQQQLLDDTGMIYNYGKGIMNFEEKPPTEKPWKNKSKDEQWGDFNSLKKQKNTSNRIFRKRT